MGLFASNLQPLNSLRPRTATPTPRTRSQRGSLFPTPRKSPDDSNDHYGYANKRYRKIAHLSSRAGRASSQSMLSGSWYFRMREGLIIWPVSYRDDHGIPYKLVSKIVRESHPPRAIDGIPSIVPSISQWSLHILRIEDNGRFLRRMRRGSFLRRLAFVYPKQCFTLTIKSLIRISPLLNLKIDR